MASASEKYASAFGLDIKQFTKDMSRSTGTLSQSYRKPCAKYEDYADQSDSSACGIRRGETSSFCIRFSKAKPDLFTVTSVRLSYRSVLELFDASLKCIDLNQNPAPIPSPALTPAPVSLCSIPLGDNSGNSSGSQCCPTGSYCRPWNVWHYQCIMQPP